MSHNCLSFLPCFMQHLIIYKLQNSCIAFSSQANPVLMNKELLLQRPMCQTSWRSPAVPRQRASALTRGKTLEPSSESVCVAAQLLACLLGLLCYFLLRDSAEELSQRAKCQMLTIKFLPILLLPFSTIFLPSWSIKKQTNQPTFSFNPLMISSSFLHMVSRFDSFCQLIFVSSSRTAWLSSSLIRFHSIPSDSFLKWTCISLDVPDTEQLSLQISNLKNFYS